jgi:hypothetical protein
MVSIVARYHGLDCWDFQIVCHQDSPCERVTHTRTPKKCLRDSLRFGRIGAIGFPHRGRQMGIPDKSPINSIGWGWARDSGGPPTSASNLPIIFVVLERCFTACFTCRLTDGVYRRGASRLTVGGANEGTKKTPDSRGYCRGFWWQVVSWEYRWVIYGFTPAGLQSHCTVGESIRQ